MEIKPGIEDAMGTYTFTVTNTSQQSQAIMDFKGGCSCVTHELTDQVLAPGAATTLKVTIDFEDAVGPTKRTIALLSRADGSGEAVRSEAVMSGTIPSPPTFNQKSAIWFYGDEATTKTVTVSVQPGVVVRDFKIENPAVSPFITVTVQPAADGRSLVATMKPTSTDINIVSPSEKATLHVPYVVSYSFPSGNRRYEKIWALLAKRPK